LRVDSGVESGSTVPDQYDPLIAKIVAWGSTRTEAINLAAGALQRARLHGITTNRDLLVGVLRHPEFLAGRFDTSFLDRYPPGDLVGGRDREQLQWAAVAAALGRQARTRTHNTPLASIPSGWRNNPSGHQHVKFDSGNGVIDVGYRFDVRGGLSVTVDYRDVAEVSAPFIAPDRVGLQVGDHLRWFDINQVATVHHVDGPDGYTRLLELDRFPTATADEPPGSMHAPMPGRVVRVMVGEGDRVEEGEVLVVLEAMKMEHSLRSPLNGTVTEVRVAPGEQVNAGQTLIVVDQPS
jgi:propionyl-CoA carboxylase alpha chain